MASDCRKSGRKKVWGIKVVIISSIYWVSSMGYILCYMLYKYYLCLQMEFLKEKCDAQKVSNLPKDPPLVTDRSDIETQVYLYPKVHVPFTYLCCLKKKNRTQEKWSDAVVQKMQKQTGKKRPRRWKGNNQ